MPDLHLDSQIRDWVLVPILIVVVLVAVIRNNLTKILKTDPKVDLKAVQQAQTLLRARRLRLHGNRIPLGSFNMRRHYFNNSDSGIFKPRADAKEANNALGLPNMNNHPMLDPNQSGQMMEMMKNNMMMVVPQVLQISWVSYVFSGFVVVKLPFSLTASFKPMLQRGVELSTLDASYVSSFSFYLLAAFGMSGINSMLLGGSYVDETQLMQQQMQAQLGGGMGGQQPDVAALYRSERDSLEIEQHSWELENVEKRLLGIAAAAAAAAAAAGGVGGGSSEADGGSTAEAPDDISRPRLKASAKDDLKAAADAAAKPAARPAIHQRKKTNKA
eukprot:TRINITY_DN2672_c1_g1_i1.p1 TRINITY_DN2672_c1_g1~~TRINITY_DN2672_c1_g1_i1.p1  ORF type:complete len:330 (+),score=151.60 TRINITY_DN2672_c1_g1_i1:63-1052(+)